MIKWSQYVSVITLTLVIFVMFMSVEPISELQGEKNKITAADTLSSNDVFSGEVQDISLLKEGKYTVILSQNGSEIEKNARLWCNFQKRKYYVTQTVSEILSNIPEFVIFDSELLDNGVSLNGLTELHKNGAVLIFANLPEYSVIQNSKELRSLLGIRGVKGQNFKVSKTKLFSGFLLSGEYFFKNIKKGYDYYSTMSGSKIYMVGMTQDSSIKNEDLPPIIWRYSDGIAPVFSVNADFCNDFTALGIYTAFVAESQSFSIYPVVNARNMVTANFPNVSKENDNVLNQKYSMSAWLFSRDFLWNNIGRIYDECGDVQVYAAMPQLSVNEEKTGNFELFSWYAQQIKKNKGQMLYSLDYEGNADDKKIVDFLTDGFEKFGGYFDKTSAVYSGELSDEQFNSVFSNKSFSSVTSVLCFDDSIISYRDGRLILGFTHDCLTNSDKERLKIISLFTCFGYGSEYADAKNLYYPKTENDTWEYIGDEWSKYHYTWTRPFLYFKSLNVSDTSNRVKRFLALDYSAQIKGSTISLDIENFDSEAFFILKLNEDEIVSVSGGEFTKIERNVYMLNIKQKNVKIKIKQKENSAP